MSSNEGQSRQSKIQFDPAKQKKRKTDPALEYKTEDQLKADTLKNMEERRLIEASRPPRPEIAKKADNFLYHYKTRAIVIVVVLFVIVAFARDVIFRTKPDITIFAISKDYISTEAVEELRAYLSTIVPDINGDGKTLVEVDVVQLPSTAVAEAYLDPLPEGFDDDEMSVIVDAEIDMANAMKIMAVLAANSDPIMLLDDASYDYILRSNAEKDSNGELLKPIDIYAVQKDAFLEQLGHLPGKNPYSLDINSTVIPLDDPKLAAFSNMSFYLRIWKETNQNRGLIDQSREFLEQMARK